WSQSQTWSNINHWKTWGLLIVGLAFFIVGQRVNEGKELPSWIKYIGKKLGSGGKLKYWQIICLVLSILATVLASSAAGYEARMNNGVVAVMAWLASIGLALSGGWQSIPKKKISKRTTITVGLLVLGAFLIRVVNVSHIPIILSGDEGSAGLSAVDFVAGRTNNIFRLGWYSFPSFYFYIQSLSISLFGQTIWALRITSVIAGALTVGAVYLMAKAMFGERVALFSAIFLAALHYHNNFSRIGLNNVWDGLWFVVILGLIWYGWEKEHRVVFLFGGLSLGIAQYFYVSVRALFGFIPIWILLVGIFNRPKFKRNFLSLLLMGLMTLVTFFPLARFFTHHPNDFFAPIARVSILGSWMDNEIRLTEKFPWQIVLKQLKLSFLGYTHMSLRHWYKPEVPILRSLPAALFFLGIAALLQKLRETSAYLLAMWLIIMGIMGGLSVEAPAAQRYMAVAPALAISVGLGLSALSTELSKVWKARAKLISVLAVLTIVLVSADELRFYFLEYTPRSDFGGDNGMVAQRLADYLQDKPSGYQVIFFGPSRMGYDSIRSLPYLAPHIIGITYNEPWGEDDIPKLTGDYLAFVFLPEHQSELEAVQVDYPLGKLLIEKNHNDQVLYILYEVYLENE
ncbi:MAG: glycosyltransferase family 39 protein, partial [Chloroflexota bacterium]|nr:glycosyltransferase family 39 protein [Chloroflexota bacterium]